MSYVKKLEEEQKAAKAAVASSEESVVTSQTTNETEEVTPESYRYPPAQIVDGQWLDQWYSSVFLINMRSSSVCNHVQ